MRSTFEHLIRRIKSEFVEMPGLTLTIEQSSRLWGLERGDCETVLHALVRRRFLSVKADGKYGRAADGVLRDVPLRTAKASLRPDRANAHSASTPAGLRTGARSSRD
jgi:hypothetical protein